MKLEKNMEQNKVKEIEMQQMQDSELEMVNGGRKFWNWLKDLEKEEAAKNTNVTNHDTGASGSW